MARLPFDPERTRQAQQARAEQSPAAPQQAGEGESPLTVSQLTGQVRRALADHFPAKARVVGEVSNFSDRAHWFFSLKDEQATLRCVCFASNARRVGFKLADGMQVVATGRLDFFDQQGHLQLYVDKLEPVGQGALELKLRHLIDELRRQGYFDEARKQPLPAVPQRIAVVTSRSAAALQDLINTTQRRWPGCQLLLYDVRVQGPEAAGEIATAIQRLSRQGGPLGIGGIILTRGGGSIEDLWAFNEREVAEALYHCHLPVVAAIGHETDTTVAELVADARCATPTQAAMTLVPDRASLDHQLGQLSHRLTTLTRRHLERARHRLHLAARHALFRQPGQLVAQGRQRLNQDQRRLNQALPRRLAPARQRLRQQTLRWRQVLPRRVEPARQQVRRLAQQLAAAMPRRLQHERRRMDAAARHLEAVSPHNVLKRGYTYTLDEQGHVIQRLDQAAAGQTITTVLYDGRIQSRVEHPTTDGEGAKTPRQPASELKKFTQRPRRSTRKQSAPEQTSLFDD